ncbi:hypothetical protein [Qipengyuania sphaerica]|uniref:hypothetical protein n=1 Tax=Qipengyuania sphaerica TaxID=2867243 RepID=UPI001C8849F4|nr:hypothetical protein [Qipengyuania sphaerica]MBX7539955.1 hypothetical protein [Qipengyuania sphaerica]
MDQRRLRTTRARAGLLACSAFMASAWAAPVHAQDGAEPSPTHIDTLRACQAIADPTARLACFDEAAATLITSADAGDLRIVDRQEVRETRRKLFGFSLPDLGIFGKRKGSEDAADEEEIDEIETTIAAVSGSHSGGYLIETQEGAVWRISDVPNRLLKPKVGDTLLIKSGALSSYFLRIGKQGGVKANRIR